VTQESGCPRKDRPAPRHPARAATESTAGLLACGSPPVTAFPGRTPVALWHGLAAYSCGGSCGLGTTGSAPHSLFALARETVDVHHLTAAFRRLSMRTAGVDNPRGLRRCFRPL
jgi:hypothetical protein